MIWKEVKVYIENDIALDKTTDRLFGNAPRKSTKYKEAALQAVEKQIPKKPFTACGHTTNRTMNYCPICGQRLDWGARQ